MDKDIAVLIIYALIKQLGMQGARSRKDEQKWWRKRKAIRKTAQRKEARIRE